MQHPRWSSDIAGACITCYACRSLSPMSSSLLSRRVHANAGNQHGSHHRLPMWSSVEYGTRPINWENAPGAHFECAREALAVANSVGAIRRFARSGVRGERKFEALGDPAADCPFAIYHTSRGLFRSRVDKSATIFSLAEEEGKGNRGTFIRLCSRSIP